MSFLVMFSTKKIEAGECPYKLCTPRVPCVPSCVCFLGTCISRSRVSAAAKMIDEHPNLCKSDEECMKKGSGNFCAPYPNHYMDYGWCVNTDSEELKSFLAMPRAISK